MLANNVRTVKTRYGEISFYADDQYVGKSLEQYGEYSELEAALWRKLIKPGDIAVDVGANIGTLTLALADMVGETGVVIAIEPQPETADLLRRNVLDNKLDDRVQVWHCALGAANGTTRVPSLATLGHKNYGGVATGSGEHEVNVRALDACFAMSRSSYRVDFIKIDVEGAEVAVLSGARTIISQDRPILYIEDHPDGGHDYLLRVVRHLGYRAFRHLPPLFNAQNWRGNAVNVFERIVSFNMLAIPSEKLEQYSQVAYTLDMLVPPSPRAGQL